MQKSKQIFARVGSCVFYLFLIVALQIAVAQTTDCPQYNQIVGQGGIVDNGMANNANVNIQLFNNSAGSFGSSAVTSTQNAMSGWTSMAGNNQTVSVSTYTGSLNDTALEATGTAANPVIVVEQLSPTAAAAQCGGSVACTSPVQDANGTTVGAIVWVSTDVVNGTPPPNYNSTLDNFLSHEIGAHDDMGWDDCASGASCANSDSGNGMYAGSGPTPCDSKQFKGQKKTTC
ncbi:MAG TPA: hypothetical protein VGK36_10060 [Candidatus Angelobacter sp.]|jgi:hypothetical protein